ncbi:MAG: hypothetical protein L3J87_05015 [Thermoplasmata archaeon]|nr:hypothetical protein [Thermoplasmata archaeon]MCI4344966.1 hypothetical protein [Thermoplasmata archaeon]
MDVPLYAIALAVFAVLYLAIGVFLAYTLVFTLIIMFAYLAIRHGDLSENYPHGVGDTMITVTFIGITWAIFTFLAPKSPVPFIGAGLTYTNGASIPFDAIITIAVVVALVFLVIGSFVARELRGAGRGGGTPSSTANAPGDSKQKQGVGAG